ncbi:MAG: hypothetical protein B6244_01565 [Candidatus Cloacimonetes bacterium 4572_55]|nr:MAG: hypothetical protein B6244_01565 [Candidatus Cloacimonetes bacterium 4572_55]
MKRFAIVMIFALLLCSAYAFAGDLKVATETSQDRDMSDDVSHIREVLFEDDFENGVNGWTTVDASALPDPYVRWHVSDFEAYEGDSWWCGNPEYNGYDNHWLQYLDTIELDLSSATNATLTFMATWEIEAPGGEPDPYNGWDTANMWISEDGGDTWEVLDPSSGPAYTFTDSYAFGDEWAFGPGIAGWGGSSNGWQEITADLSAYTTDEVKIRFAFCSDPAASTADGNPTWHGFHVDNIVVSDGTNDIFTNDGEDNGDLAASGGAPPDASGDFWELSDGSSHSSSHAWNCPDGHYLLQNALVSPSIELPAEADIINFRFWLWCDMGDFDGDDDGSLDDLYRVQISTDGIGFEPVFYDYGDDTRPGGLAWTEYLPGMAFNGNIDMDLIAYAGETIQLRWIVESDGDDDGGIDSGLWIDDVVVEAFTAIDAFPPCNLQGTYDSGNEVVDLVWEEPCAGPADPWLHWDDGANNDAIGLTNGGTFTVAARFDGSDMEPYVGHDLTEMKVWANVPTVEYLIKVWEGGSNGNPGTEIYNAQLTDIEDGDWTTHVFNSPITIQDGNEYWMGYQVTHAAGEFVAGCDVGPMVSNKGGWISTDGVAWDQIAALGLDVNWNIQGHVPSVATAFNRWVVSDEIIDTPNLDIDLSVAPGNHVRDTRDLPEYYLVYRSFTPGNYADSYAQIDDPTALNWTDENIIVPPSGSLTYYYVMTAVYENDFESEVSNETFVEVFTEGVEDPDVDSKVSFNVNQNYPNPIASHTTISYSIPETAPVSVAIYNATGQHVRSLVNKQQTSGDYEVSWNGTNDSGEIVSGGVYFYTVKAGDHIQSRQMVLLR